MFFLKQEKTIMTEKLRNLGAGLKTIDDRHWEVKHDEVVEDGWVSFGGFLNFLKRLKTIDNSFGATWDRRLLENMLNH